MGGKLPSSKKEVANGGFSDGANIAYGLLRLVCLLVVILFSKGIDMAF